MRESPPAKMSATAVRVSAVARLSSPMARSEITSGTDSRTKTTSTAIPRHGEGRSIKRGLKP
ncbi:hypothetical protein D3C75_1191700 [compost metagenome]